jgi:hypothetical protein
MLLDKVCRNKKILGKRKESGTCQFHKESAVTLAPIKAIRSFVFKNQFFGEHQTNKLTLQPILRLRLLGLKCLQQLEGSCGQAFQKTRIGP